MKNSPLTFVFFGSDAYAVMVLDELEKAGYIPTLIVTSPDVPVGRKLVITSPPAKVWAMSRQIPVVQPNTWYMVDQIPGIWEDKKFDLFIVAFYNKIIPQNILDIPKYGALNIHPSLLPRLRGPSPTKTAILSENETGVSIILLDAEMDHGPILAQEKVAMPEWPSYNSDLQTALTHRGAELLVKVIPEYIAGKITPMEQDHTAATFSKKIKKEDALIDLADDPEKNVRKIRAYDTWPRAYFIAHHGNRDIRVIITRANITDGKLDIEKVIPEGKKEMSYADFQRGLRN